MDRRGQTKPKQPHTAKYTPSITPLFCFFIIKDVIELLKGSFKNTAQHKHVFSAALSENIIMRRFRLQHYSMRQNWFKSHIRSDEKNRLTVKRFIFYPL